MSDFLYLYRAERPATAFSPAETQAQMQKWVDWMKELGAQGHLKDGGQPLDPTGKQVRGKAVVTDGPYGEAKDLVGGYTIVSAKDLDQASALAAGCPVLLAPGGSVEVRPILSM